MQSAIVGVVGLGVLLAGGMARAADDDPRPWAEQPFLGLYVRDGAHGPVVSWIVPGPLGGRGTESTLGVRRDDNLVSVDGEPRDAEALKAYVRSKKPGDEVTLVLRRSSEANPESAVPHGGEGGEPFTVKATLGSRDRWAGRVGRGLGGRVVPPTPEGELEKTLIEGAKAVGAWTGKEGVGGGLEALLPYLAKVQEDALDPDSLSAVVQCFRRPLSADAVARGLDPPLQAVQDGDPAHVEALVRAVLDQPSPPAGEGENPDDDALVREAGARLETWAKDWRSPLETLLRTLTNDVYVYDEHADQHVETINRIGGPHAREVMALALVLLRHAPAAWEAEARTHADPTALAEVPPDVRAAVEGDVLWAGKDPLGHLAVVGGPGPNRYEMSKLGAVYDVGGDDEYDYGASPPFALRVVIDLAGNDRHLAKAAFEGPATTVLGLSWLDDRAGNDVYRTESPFGVGAGLMGVGVLLDRGGNDVYESMGKDSGWGLGAGFWGVGLLIDQDGADVYRGERYVEGVGGPRGIGAIVDRRGNDLYVADGPDVPSAYGTPAVYAAMSQAFGFGVRGYAAGGLGAIEDLGGNDRYDAGEFAQAGGYYFGLGLLHDVSGDDLYHGNRYGQAFAAHEAIGILVDDQGSDTYWSMTAASQAGTWDQSIGLLLDRAGNDAYRCDGLGQGSAAMQAIAILADQGGDDRYAAAAASAQGQGGGNEYHYDADKVFSFSALLDLGGGRDVYSSGRKDDTTVGTGAFDEKNPAGSPLYGLFLDR